MGHLIKVSFDLWITFKANFILENYNICVNYWNFFHFLHLCIFSPCSFIMCRFMCPPQDAEPLHHVDPLCYRLMAAATSLS